MNFVPLRDNTTANALLKTSFLAVVLLFSGLMLQIIVPYLLPPFRTDIDFLLTKQNVLHLSLWRYAFYIHISTSILTLLAGLTQFSRRIYLQYPKIHRTVGKVYLITVLVAAAPSGLIMAFYANGGTATRAAFVVLAIGWWVFTLVAFRQIKAGRVRPHAAFMLRSYALTWSAVTLRLMQFLFGYFMLLDYQTAYLVSAWGGFIINLLLCELLICKDFLDYYIPKIIKKE